MGDGHGEDFAAGFLNGLGVSNSNSIRAWVGEPHLSEVVLALILENDSVASRFTGSDHCISSYP